MTARRSPSREPKGPRRSPATPFALLGAIAVSAALATPAAAQQRPNLIVLLADDLGYADLGPYDDDADPQTPDVTNTPNLDQMASEGLRMSQFYSSAPVCSPTRAALLTGRHHARLGITGVFGPNDPTGSLRRRSRWRKC